METGVKLVGIKPVGIKPVGIKPVGTKPVGIKQVGISLHRTGPDFPVSLSSLSEIRLALQCFCPDRMACKIHTIDKALVRHITGLTGSRGPV